MTLFSLKFAVSNTDDLFLCVSWTNFRLNTHFHVLLYFDFILTAIGKKKLYENYGLYTEGPMHLKDGGKGF